jgi:hypothetical protein
MLEAPNGSDSDIFIYRISTDSGQNIFIYRISTDLRQNISIYRISTDSGQNISIYRISTDLRQNISIYRISTDSGHDIFIYQISIRSVTLISFDPSVVTVPHLVWTELGKSKFHSRLLWGRYEPVLRRNNRFEATIVSPHFTAPHPRSAEKHWEPDNENTCLSTSLQACRVSMDQGTIVKKETGQNA